MGNSAYDLNSVESKTVFLLLKRCQFSLLTRICTQTAILLTIKIVFYQVIQKKLMKVLGFNFWSVCQSIKVCTDTFLGIMENTGLYKAGSIRLNNL